MMRGTEPPMECYYLDVVDESNYPVKVVIIDREKFLGRDSDGQALDIIVPAQYTTVSKRHAVLGFSEGHPVLKDTSRFGTVVNGQLVHGQSVVLQERDRIVFGGQHDGWRVEVRFEPKSTTDEPLDPIQLLTVSTLPRRIMLGNIQVEEHLGDKAFLLLHFLSSNRGLWFPTDRLADVLWPNPDEAPLNTRAPLSNYKKKINDLLRPYFDGQEAIESRPFQGYRMKTRLDSLTWRPS